MKRDVDLKERNDFNFNKKVLEDIKISEEEELFINNLFKENKSENDSVVEDTLLKICYTYHLADNFYTDINNRRSKKRRRKYRTNFKNGKKINI